MRVAGWICFSVGMVLLILCPIIPFYSPFFLVSFVLAIVLLVRDEGRGGLALLLTTILVPTAVGGVIFMLGVGAMMAAFTGFAKEVEDNQNALVAQQSAVLNRLSGPQAQFSQPAIPQPAPSRPIFFQPPAAPVQPPAATPLPAREVTYGGLLQVLNELGNEYNSANTTLQKKDVRTRAQAKAATFVENTRMTLAGAVADIKDDQGGKVTLSFRDFDAPDQAIKTRQKLFAPSSGSLTVSMTRATALGVKKGQKVWITGRPNIVSQDNLVVAMLDEATNPSLITFRFLMDIEPLLVLRMRDYTVSFEDKHVQAAPRVKKPYSLVVVPPKASP